MNQLKNIMFQIETNRQRLEHAVQTDNSDLQIRTMRLLINFHDELYTAVTTVLENKMRLIKNTDDLKLVFSDKTPDGKVMSRNEYVKLCKSMSRSDFECHIALDVEPTIEADLSDIIEELSSETESTSANVLSLRKA